jgi:uncharacterized Zn-binding protein involved in type VI secretion
MGTPACTITSQTAHQGIVTVGFPTVLIGFLPASRIGDLHVCPMTTGPVPHVGGPFILGSPTVIVGEMCQSRVGDQLTCVGPPDVAVLGCETVLVGAAGGGGAASAVAGIQAMGAPVPMQNPASSSSSQPKAELQQDGTIKTSGVPGGRLPPSTLSQPGWPDLPADQAPNFQSAQPVNLPPNTKLYRVIGDANAPDGCHWSLGVPADEASWRQGNAVKPKWNNDGQFVCYTVPKEGLKAWMGPSSSQGEFAGGAIQFYVPLGTVKPGPPSPTPWAGKGKH